MASLKSEFVLSESIRLRHRVTLFVQERRGSGVVRTERGLDVGGQGQQVALEHGQGDVDRVAAQAVDAREKVDGRFELAGQEEHLEVEERLLVGLEVALAVLLEDQRLELGVRQPFVRRVVRRRLVLLQLAQLDPQVVVGGQRHFGVVVVDVAGRHHAVGGAATRTRR